MKAKKRLLALFMVILALCLGMFVLTSCKSCTKEPDDSGSTEIKLVSISMDTKPTKLVYEIGEEVDTTGMKVTAKFSNDTTKDVTSQCTTSMDGQRIKAETTSYFVKYTYEKVTKTARVDITVNKEDITVSDLEDSEELKEVHVVAQESTADMVFVTSVDSGTMHIDGVLELTGTVASGTFKYSERNDYLGEITNIDGSPILVEDVPLSRKMIVMTGSYTTSDGEMMLRTKTISHLRTARVDNATVQVAEVITNDDGEITGINFGSMVKDNKSNLFFGWGKTDASAFIESNAQNFELEPYICYFSRVNDGVIPSDIRMYHAPVTSIEIEHEPVKTEYAPGEALSTIGLAVRINFAAGKSIVVTDGFSVDKDVLSEDDTTVTVSYNGYYAEAKTCTFDITVQSAYEEGLYALEIVDKITDFSYTYGEYQTLTDVLKASAMTVKAKYVNGSEPDKIVTDYTVTGYDAQGNAIEGNKITPDLKYYEISYTEGERTVKTSVNVGSVTIRTPYNVAEASDADYVFYTSFVNSRTNNTNIDVVLTMTEGETAGSGTFLAQMYVTASKGVCISGTYTVDGDNVSFTSLDFAVITENSTNLFKAVDETAEFVKNDDGEIIGLDFGAKLFGATDKSLPASNNSAESIGKPADATCLVLIKDHNMGSLDTHYGNKIILPEAIRFTVNGANITDDTVEMVVGETLNLLATFTPGNTTDQRVTWAFEGNDGIASFEYKEGYGVFTALKAGEFTATATSVKDPELSVTCTVKVLAIAVTGVELDQTELTLLPDAQPVTLTVTVAPANATDKSLSWESSDENVVTVADGVVTVVGEGEATITVTTADGGFTATCTVTVAGIKVTGVTLDKQTLSILLDSGETKTLVATVAPADAADKRISWASSDESIATVNENGVVTAVAAGTTTITVTTIDGGYTATCEVTVVTETIAATGVSLNKTELSLNPKSAPEALTAVIAPADATNTKVNWESSDETVATVNENGVVTAVAIGEATITVTTEDGGFTATCTVTVSAVAATGVSVDETAVIERGSTKALTAVVAPADATNTNVSWASSDETVATVDENGVVAAVAIGEATITVTTEDGGFTATCAVTVKLTATEISLNETALDLGKGHTSTLTVNYVPADTTVKGVVWSSLNDQIATVDEDGVVTAVSAGTVRIMATYAVEGGEALTAICVVNVKTGLKNLYLENKVYNFKITPYDKLYGTTLEEALTETDFTVKAQYWDSDVEDKDVTSSVVYDARDNKDEKIDGNILSEDLYSYIITYTEGEGDSAVTIGYRMGNKDKWGDGDVTVELLKPYEAAATSTADLAFYSWARRQNNLYDVCIELFYTNKEDITEGGTFIVYVYMSAKKIYIMEGNYTVGEDNEITFSYGEDDKKYVNTTGTIVNATEFTQKATIVYAEGGATVAMLDFGVLSINNGFFADGNKNWSEKNCKTDDDHPNGSIGETIGDKTATHMYAVVLKGYTGTVKSNYTEGELTLHLQQPNPDEGENGEE